MSLDNISELNTAKKASMSSNSSSTQLQSASSSTDLSKIISGMTIEQAEIKGITDTFNQVDTNHNKVISQEELMIAKSKLFDVESLKGKSNIEVIDTIMDYAAKDYGISRKDLEQLSAKNKEVQKTNLDNILESKYNLSKEELQKMSKDEKIERLGQIIEQKYSMDDSGSVYQKEYARLKQGDFTETEKTKLGLGGLEGKLTDEQIQHYAKLAVCVGKTMEFLSLMNSVESQEEKQMLLKVVGNTNIKTQTMVYAIAYATAEDNDTKKSIIDNFIQNVKSKIDGTTETGKLILKAIEENRPVAEILGFLKNSFADKFGGAEGQYNAYVITDSVQKERLASGEITQEEYDNIYSGEYAETASYLENASRAYQYVIDHTSDSNRSATMQTLASNVGNIKDINQRRGAMSNIKATEYYQNNKQNLDATMQGSIAKNSNKGSGYSVSATTKSAAAYTSNPIQSNNENNYKKTDEILQNGSPQEIKEVTVKAIKEADKKNKEYRQQQRDIKHVVQILNKVISTGMLQNSEYEPIVLEHLRATAIPTLLNIFRSADDSVKEYFLHKTIITKASIITNIPITEMLKYSDTVQELIGIDKKSKEAS